MAQEFDRRINLYINIDGKEVSNSVKAIRGEMTHMINAQAKMAIGSAEYVKEAGKIKQLKGILDRHRANITETKSAWSGLIEKAKGLLPAFGFAAIAAVATKAFTAIKNSTHATADAFEFAMAGMSTGLDFFWKTLATGDWSNFFTNLNNAIVGGYKYAEMLDEVADNNRALRIIESKARGQELKLEEDLKNKLLSPKARIQAGKDRIALEEKLSLDRQAIANKNYIAEFDEATRVTKLNEDQLLSVAGVIDSQQKMEATAYNEKKARLEKLQRASETTVDSPYASVYIPSVDTDEMVQLKNEINLTSDSVKNYATFLKSYDIMAESQQDKLVAAVELRDRAINSAPENLKKVITRVNSLLAGQEDNGQKIEDTANKARLDSIEAANSKELTLIKKRHLETNNSEGEYNSEVLAQDLKFLNKKAAVYAKGSKEYEEIQLQIQERLLKYGDEAIKIQLATDEAINSSEISAIKKRHLEGKSTEDQYNAELLTQEMLFLQKKLTTYKARSKEYEDTQMQLLEKQVSAEQTVNELLLKAQKGLADAGIENLKDGIEKEKAIEKQRWEEELAELQKQLKTKEDLNAQELALNDTINKTIEERRAAHQKRTNDLDLASAIQSQMDTALIDEARATTDAEKFAAAREIAQANYQQQLADAKGNSVAIARAERALSDELVRIKQDEQARKQAIQLAIVDAAYNMFGALVELVGKETALGKALFVFQQAAAVGQIIINTAIANSKALAEFPGPVGIALAVMNSVAAAAGIASVLAQTFKAFSPPAAEKSGYESGGFTQGEAFYKAGEKGKKEWISPNWMLNNPISAPIIAGLESWRQTRYVPTSGAFETSKQFSNPVFSNPNSTQKTVEISGQTTTDPELKKILAENARVLSENSKAIKEFMNWNPAISIETYERKKDNWKKTINGGLK